MITIVLLFKQDKSMTRIEYLSNPGTYTCKSEFVAFMPKINNEKELLEQLGIVLKFPNYYGENWNAVYDCLCDFSWIIEKGVVLIHTEIPALPEDGLKIYMQILDNSIESWKLGEDHYFKVVFPTT
ncbi:barstar family protein [Chitinophaga caseinilytica]|uniref:barstar family protein n=1 Tax=Chitinophaga caseinilytica TaxID=2267521 RepID=UPI003C2C7822